MNDKQKQIEEMAKDLNSCIAIMTTESFGDCLEIAKFLIDLDYRRIDKGSVVLTKEEYEAMNRNIKQLNKAVKHYQELIEDGKLVTPQQAIKEFAERLKSKLE